MQRNASSVGAENARINSSTKPIKMLPTPVWLQEIRLPQPVRALAEGENTRDTGRGMVVDP